MSTERPTPPDGYEQFESEDPDSDVPTVELGPGDVLGDSFSISPKGKESTGPGTV